MIYVCIDLKFSVKIEPIRINFDYDYCFLARMQGTISKYLGELIYYFEGSSYKKSAQHYYITIQLYTREFCDIMI